MLLAYTWSNSNSNPKPELSLRVILDKWHHLCKSQGVHFQFAFRQRKTAGGV